MKKIIIGFIILFFCISCTKKNTESRYSNFLLVTIPPQKTFLKSIVGDKFKINVLIGKNQNPHYSELTPLQLKFISDSKVYFKLGSGMEFEKKLLNKIRGINKNIKIVDCSKNIELKNFTKNVFFENNTSNHTHAHDSHSSHIHNNNDPHIWLSPENVKKICLVMKNYMCDFDNSNKKIYEKGYLNIINKIMSFQKEIKQKVKKLKNKNFLVFHPAWGYFANEFELNQFSIECEGKFPSIRELNQILENVKKNNINLIFISKEFNVKFADIIAKNLGGNTKTVIMEPLEENYFDNLNKFVSELDYLN